MENKAIDIEYVHRVIRGDTAAFRFLVEKYQKMVFTIAVRIVRNREGAEDVAQEAFMKCFKALNTYNQQSQFSTWLYRITYNHAIDTIKKTKHKRFISGLDESFNYPGAVQPSAEADLDNKILQSTLKEAIAALPEEDSIIVLLYYYDEQPLKEIAGIMGIKENNVKIRLHRIRARLMQQLQSKQEIISRITF